MPLLPQFLRISRLPLLLAVPLVVLSACSSNDDDEDSLLTEAETIPVEQLYNEAQAAMDKRGYKLAVEKFEQVEQQHPYSPWANRAQVMAAYANYQQENYEGAIEILQRFVRLHPGNENIAYAYYLLALCHYEQITDIGRDQSKTADAQRALEEVMRRFPNTDYARDAKLKLDLTVDHLAGKELEVGRYYLVRGEILPAINRFRNVVDNYQTTSQVPEALHRLTEAYLSLGVTDEARKYAAVLGYNYPDSPWYHDSYRMLVPESQRDAAAKDPKSFWQRWLPKKQ